MITSSRSWARPRPGMPVTRAEAPAPSTVLWKPLRVMIPAMVACPLSGEPAGRLAHDALADEPVVVLPAERRERQPGQPGEMEHQELPGHVVGHGREDLRELPRQVEPRVGLGEPAVGGMPDDD